MRTLKARVACASWRTAEAALEADERCFALLRNGTGRFLFEAGADPSLSDGAGPSPKQNACSG